MATDEQRSAGRLMYAIDRVSTTGQDNSNLFTPEFLEEYCLPLSNMELEKNTDGITLFCTVNGKRIERVMKYPFKTNKFLPMVKSLDDEFVELCRSGS